MNIMLKTHLTFLLITLALLLHVATVFGQNVSQYTLTGTIVGSSNMQGNGQYWLASTAGQIATETSSGDRYSVTQNFEPVITDPTDNNNIIIYLPLVQR